jgi:hypothetical protein
MSRKPLHVAAIIAAAQEKSARSPLYRWMSEHYEELEPVLSQRGPDWAAMAERFADAGVLAGKGKTPDARLVAKTWTTVKRDKGAVPPRARTKPQPTVRPAPAAAKAPIARPPSPEEDDEPEPPRRGFQFSKAKPKSYKKE